MMTLDDVLKAIDTAQDERKSVVAQIKELEKRERDSKEGWSEEDSAKADELLQQLEDKDTEIGDLHDQETELRDKRAKDETRTSRLKAAAASGSQPIGRRVPTDSGPIGGDEPGMTQVNVRPPTAEELAHDVGTLIRAVALSRGQYDRVPEIVQNQFGNDRLFMAMSAGDFAAGGAWIPENYVPQIIELLRPRSVVRRMGAQNPPLINGSLTLPKVTQGSSANYLGENTNAITSEMRGGQLILRAKKLVALVPVSNDLLRYSSPSADALVRNDLIRALAVAEDGAFIRDDGTGNAPKGLRYWAPAANVIAANATVTLANVTFDLGKLELALQNANVMMTNPGYVMAPRTANYLQNLRDGNGNIAFPEMASGNLRGYPYATTTQIPITLGGGNDESEIYFADFDDVIIAEAASIELEASNVAAYHDGSGVVAAFSQDQTVIRAIAQHDLGVRHDEAVAVLTGVTWGA